jgi:hypothetical protein
MKIALHALRTLGVLSVDVNGKDRMRASR